MMNKISTALDPSPEQASLWARLMARDDSPVASKQSWSLARPVAVSSTAVLSVLSVALGAMI
jgi:hypothetical protein